jgi:drug/metabolite transporter (DMT)-like permease
LNATHAAPPAWLPITVLLFSASLWGLSWWPLKGFAAAGLPGPLLSLLTYGSVGLVGLPLLLRERTRWRNETGLLVLLMLVGGWANTAFVNALMLGDVVRVMLLFYLAPVWSVLGGRLFLGEVISRRRAAAVGLALGGIFLVVGGFSAWGAPVSTADLLAVSAGMAFAGNNIVSRAAQSIPMRSKTIAVFVGCGFASLLMMQLLGTGSGTHRDWPAPTLGLIAALAAYAFGWLVLATATWQYGVTHLEAGRSGVILIAELLVALVSASLLGSEHLAPREWAGSVLIALAALLEATDTATGTTPHLAAAKEPA